MKKIGELLTGRPVVTLDAEATALDAVRAMRDQEVGAVLVTEAGRVAGIFTERDLMLRVVAAELDPGTARLGDHMSREMVSAGPERALTDIAREMQTRHIRHLPVLRGGEVVGMLSLRDVLRELLVVKRREVQDLTAYIQGEGELEA